jgi:hypothetical protein
LPDPAGIVAHLSRTQIFLFVLVAWLLLGCSMARFLEPINAVPGACKAGISLQMADSEARVHDVLESWGDIGRLRVAYTIGLDALYIILYVALLTLGCRMAANGFTATGKMHLATLGLLLAWAGVAAGLFDCVENWGQMQFLTGHLSSRLPAIVRFCSWTKFILSGAAGVYVLVAMAVLRSKFFA